MMYTKRDQLKDKIVNVIMGICFLISVAMTGFVFYLASKILF